jgi:hypothetical protein
VGNAGLSRPRSPFASKTTGLGLGKVFLVPASRLTFTASHRSGREGRFGVTPVASAWHSERLPVGS